jgi:hypothetical protein
MVAQRLIAGWTLAPGRPKTASNQLTPFDLGASLRHQKQSRHPTGVRRLNGIRGPENRRLQEVMPHANESIVRTVP